MKVEREYYGLAYELLVVTGVRFGVDKNPNSIGHDWQ